MDNIQNTTAATTVAAEKLIETLKQPVKRLVSDLHAPMGALVDILRARSEQLAQIQRVQNGHIEYYRTARQMARFEKRRAAKARFYDGYKIEMPWDVFARPEVKDFFAGLIYYSILPAFFAFVFFRRLTFSDWGSFLKCFLNWKTVALGILFALPFGKWLYYVGNGIAAAKGTANEKKDIPHYVRIVEGKSGSGKSSFTMYSANVLRRIKERVMLMTYWTIDNIPEERRTDSQKLDYAEARDAIAFYKSHPNAIPCFITNTGAKVKGRYTLKLSDGMLLQKERIPAYSVIVSDENGFIMAAVNGKSQAASDCGELSRFTRHYAEAHWFLLEQRGTNNINQWRSNCAFIQTMQSQTPVCRPWLLGQIVSFLDELLYLSKFSINGEKFDTFYRYVKGLYYRIGFRRYKFNRTYGVESQAGAGGDKFTRITPARLGVWYNDRAYRQGYKAINKDITAEVYDNLLISVEDFKTMRKLKKKFETPKDDIAEGSVHGTKDKKSVR